MQWESRYPAHPGDVKFYTTPELREAFLIPALFRADEALLCYSHFDRMIAGGLMPVQAAVALEGGPDLASEYFLERRELGVINVGGAGRVRVDGEVYALAPRDGLYVGLGAKTLLFESDDPDAPAKFYLNSAPAHTAYPTVKIDVTQAAARPMGSAEGCNKRVIHQYIHPAVLKSCQLCMGLTSLEPGGNWNSMPCHTHERRMEVYFYFDLAPEDVVFHMMGQPQETRHILLHNEQAVISPSWSIHCGVGTRNYSFIWGMCGENQDFDDMDGIAPETLQ